MTHLVNQLPKFIIKNKFQKRKELYEDIITKDILIDICRKLIGKDQFEVQFDNSGYNKGRLALLNYDHKTFFISFSEINIEGRNSSFQSLPTALFLYMNSDIKNKTMCFYFHPKIQGLFETEYFNILYRIMKTIGIVFLNEDILTIKIKPYLTDSELIREREYMKLKNRRNKATNITVQDNVILIKGKVYGASKYESPLIALALSNISRKTIIFEQIPEGDLKILPKPAIDALLAKRIKLIESSHSLQPESVLNDSKLRTQKYLKALEKKFGKKKCILCENKNPKEIQGAHIKPVFILRNEVKEKRINIDDAWSSSIDKENGLWLCKFHHHLFDQGLLKINIYGIVEIKKTLKIERIKSIKEKTSNYSLPQFVLTKKFLQYLSARNYYLNDDDFSPL
tara:strand:+ start:2470 stop:3660 length:1191 start_codon:yes stop_codon:yes gene_type:complete